MKLIGILYYGVARAAPSLGAMIMASIFSLRFGNSGFAAYSLAFVVATIASAISTTWLQTALVRQAGLNLSKTVSRKLVMTVAFTSSGISLVATYFTYASIFSYSFENVIQISLAAAVAAFGISLHTVAFALWQIRQEEFRIAVNGGLRAVAPLIALLFAVVLDSSISQATIFALISHAISAPWLMLLRRHEQMALPRSELWSFGRPLVLWTVLSFLLQGFDRIVIALIVSAESAGMYALISDTLGKGTNLLLTPYVTWIAPKLMMTRNDFDPRTSKNHYLSCIKTSVFLATLIYAAAIAVFVVFLHSKNLLGSLNPVLIFSIGIVSSLWTLGLVAHKGLEMSNRTRLMPACMGIAVVVYAAGTAILTPKFHLWGATLSALLSACSYLALSFLLSVQSLNQVTNRPIPDTTSDSRKERSLHCPRGQL